MKVMGNAIRPGMVIQYKEKLMLVTKIELRTPGNLRAFNQVEMVDVVTGTKFQDRFASTDTIERVRLDQKSYQYLYDEGDFLVFMDQENFEQISVQRTLLGDQVDFLEPNMVVEIETYEGRPLGVTMPETVVMAVKETEPSMKGQTASGSFKPATLENGVRIMVPPYLAAGEKVVVRIADREYLERSRT